jgi:hypothetical protein
VSSSIFRAWACDGYGYSTTETHYYLREDLSIICYTSFDHFRVRGVALVLVALWPVGCLLLYAGLLFAARKAILTRKPTNLVRRIAFLHRDYVPPGTRTVDPIASVAI